jgi:Fe-coproporphyrin III synthase
MINRLLTFATNRILNLPVIVLMPHSRCNCRCIMCDIWKANQNKKEISREELQRHVAVFGKLGVREIVFSGGEALMHSNLWALCELIKIRGIKITLLSTGLLLERNAAEVVRYIDNVIVSIDGSENIHDQIRNIPGGYRKIAEGIAALRKLKPGFRITARCVIQRYNYRDFPNIVSSARAIGLDQISFLAADVSSTAFNHPENIGAERIGEIALSKSETNEFETILRSSFLELRDEYEQKFIAENPKKMMKILHYYKALNGLADFPTTVCNAPWVSAVIESNGDVLPCFFHKPYGNIYGNQLTQVLNSPEAIEFRKKLSVTGNEICKKCVCSLKLGLTQMN